jgi:hypothetical protein
MNKSGLNKGRRWFVCFLPRQKLEAASCECYQVIRDEMAKFTKSMSDSF